MSALTPPRTATPEDGAGHTADRPTTGPHAAPVPAPLDDLQPVLDAFAAMAGAPTEDDALARAVDVARLATGAHLGAAVLAGEDGVTHLVHAGMTAVEVSRLPGPPQGRGVLGAVLAGELVRVDDVATHPAWQGAVPHHPPMEAFLGVPVTGDDDEVLGAFYLSKPPGQAPFGDGDQSLVAALARQCGAVVVRLRALRRGERLAARLVQADGVRAAAVQRMTEALDPVEAVDSVLEMAREQLGMPLVAVVRVRPDGSQEVERVAGVLHGGSTPLPGTPLPARSLCGRVVTVGPVVVPDVALAPELAEEAAAWPGVAAYVGVPVVVGGTVRGSLCAVSDTPTDLTGADVAVLEVVADVAARQLARREAATLLRTRREDQLAPHLAHGGLAVVLQPVVDLRDGTVIGVEALARPTGFPGGPAELFAEAAALGLGVEAELAAVDAALALLPTLPDDVQMGVNVGPATACDPRLHERVAAATAGRSHRVVVELTEHEDTSAHPDLPSRLADLRALGARVAIDDAGAGYAGLRTIVDLSPDVLKLDISLVSGIDTHPARRALVSSLVALAHELGAYLVAEGVERPGELAVLRGLGVAAAQGFYLARPVPRPLLDLRPRAVVAVPRPLQRV